MNDLVLKHILQTHAVMMLILDPGSARILDANIAACHHYGYPMNEFVGMSLLDLDAEPHQDVISRIASAGKTGSGSFEVRHRLRDATVRDMRIDATAVGSGEESPLFCTLSDITDHKRFERELIDEREKFRSLIERIPEGVIIHRLDGTIVYMNEAALNMIRGGKEDVKGKSISDFTVQDDHDVMKTRTDMVLRGNDAPIMTQRIRRMDGTQFWARINAVVIDYEGEKALMPIVVDIDVIIHAESVLIETNSMLTKKIDQESARRIASSRRYRHMIDSASELISLLDPTHRFRVVNRRFLDFHDAQEQDVIGRTPGDIVDNEFTKLITPHIETVMTGKSVSIQRWIESPRFGSRFMSVSLTPFTPDDQPEVDGVMVVGRDITDMKRAEDERTARELLLVQQSKMAELGNMMGVIAHQWKQPLSVISLLLQNLELEYGDVTGPDGSLQQRVDAVMEHVSFMSTTIDDFRNFFKPRQSEVVFSPQQTVNEVINLFGRLFASEGITVSVNVKRDFTVLGQPNHFTQVIMNVLNNAREVLIQRTARDGHIKIVIDSDGETGTLRISDNGGGIPESLLPDGLFEPFTSTKGDDGTGIGMHICKTIMERIMHGTISAANTELGAEFVLRIPCVSDRS